MQPIAIILKNNFTLLPPEQREKVNTSAQRIKNFFFERNIYSIVQPFTQK